VIDTGPVIKKLETGPVIRVDPALARELKSSRWRTLGSDRRPTGWAANEAERCTSCCGTTIERRCMLRDGHVGLHAWRSLGGLRVFEWG
jgi:hypothetical protein